MTFLVPSRISKDTQLKIGISYCKRSKQSNVIHYCIRNYRINYNIFSKLNYQNALHALNRRHMKINEKHLSFGKLPSARPLMQHLVKSNTCVANARCAEGKTYL